MAADRKPQRNIFDGQLGDLDSSQVSGGRVRNRLGTIHLGAVLHTLIANKQLRKCKAVQTSGSTLLNL